VSDPGHAALPAAPARARARPGTRAPAARREQEALISALLRPVVYMLAAFVFAFPLATPEVARWVAGGALLGAIAGRPLAHTSLRLYVVLLGALAGALGIAALRSAALAMPALSAALGPADALSAINALCYAVLS
jgi:hypothetical protein